MDPNVHLTAWDWAEPVTAEHHPSGLINDTYWVRSPDNEALAVLQRLNTRIFRPEVHHDIEAVTTTLAAKGLVTPRLIATRTGDLWHTDAQGGCWRCLTVVGDRTVHKLTDPADAVSAGHLIARFHAALADLDWRFRMVRPDPHDTPRHMAALADAVAEHPEHRLHAEVAPLAEQIAAAWSRWDGGADLPERIIHGDLKISNVRFQGGEAIALIDLDTLARRTLDVELGDAMRSWCNPVPEDSLDARFDPELFAAAMAGYARGSIGSPGPTEAEWNSIVPTLERIALELAARFAADALREAYFGWDPKFGGRGEHNLARAKGQAALAASVAAQRAVAEEALAQARATA